MPISLPDLVALRHRIESDILRSQEELKAVQLLEKKLRAENGAAQPELPLDMSRGERPSFADSVRAAVRTYTQDEFTVANIENFLKQQKVTLPAKHIRARIAMILQDLTTKGAVKIASKGSGNTPHRYRLLIVDENPEKSEGTSARTLVPSRVQLRPVRTPTPTV